MSARAQLFQSFSHPAKGLVPRHIPFAAALHRANDGRRAESTGKIDYLRYEILCSSPDFTVGIRQAQFMPQPSGACSNCGELNLMPLKEPFELEFVHVIGCSGKYFDAVK